VQDPEPPPRIGLAMHTGEVLSVYLMEPDIEKVVEFLTRKSD
jgi:hypothetical protein